jgi:hypothetical protein
MRYSKNLRQFKLCIGKLLKTLKMLLLADASVSNEEYQA